MPDRGQPRALDAPKQKTVCSLVATGVSLRQAAHFVNCDPKTIRREAQRNDDFRRELAKAKSEASMQPLATVRRAANSNWRAALCFMEHLEPRRFARESANIITQREANQFATDLFESVERVVSNPVERHNVFELIAAALPAAMRRRWDAITRRCRLAQAIAALDGKRKMTPLADPFPRDSLVNDPFNMRQPPAFRTQPSAIAPNAARANEVPTNNDTSTRPNGELLACENTVPSPRPYSNPIAEEPCPNLEPINTLPPTENAHPPE